MSWQIYIHRKVGSINKYCTEQSEGPGNLLRDGQDAIMEMHNVVANDFSVDINKSRDKCALII